MEFSSGHRKWKIESIDGTIDAVAGARHNPDSAGKDCASRPRAGNRNCFALSAGHGGPLALNLCHQRRHCPLFNVFVLVVQLFEKVPALKALAPTQSEPPFKVTQLIVLVAFVFLTIAAVIKFRRAA